MVDAALRKGRELPDWYVQEPPLLPVSSFFLSAFFDLTTERQLGMAPGPIPWSSMLLYARQRDLDAEIFDAFAHVIRVMDTAYLGWLNEQAEKQRKQKTRNKR